MDRRPLPSGYLAAALLALATVFAAGCTQLASTIAYVATGFDQPAEFAGLKGRVIVICQSKAGLEWRDNGASRDLARQMSILLREHLPKVKVVDQQKVAAWLDENPSNEFPGFPAAGKALNADMVVGVDMTSFSLDGGSGMRQGKATLSMKVFDLSKAKDEQIVFERRLIEAVYPPNMPIYYSEQSENTFRMNFVQNLADQIARNFYPHDPHGDICTDNMASRP